MPININIFRGLGGVNDNIFRAFFNELNINSEIRISGKLDNHLGEKRSLVIKPATETIENVNKQKGSDIVVNRYSETTRDIKGLILECHCLRQGKHKNLQNEPVISEIIFEGENGEKRLVKLPRNYIERFKGVFVNPSTVWIDQSKKFDELQTRKQIPRIIKVLKQIDPSIINLTLGRGGIIKCDVGLKELIPVNSLGRGLGKLLSILLAIATTENGVVLIDEIGNGFYYSSKRKVWDAVFRFAKEYNVQIFATTHSLECVKALSESHAELENNKDNIRLFRIEIKDGNIKPIKYDYKILETSLNRGWEIR